MKEIKIMEKHQEMNEIFYGVFQRNELVVLGAGEAFLH